MFGRKKNYNQFARLGRVWKFNQFKYSFLQLQQITLNLLLWYSTLFHKGLLMCRRQQVTGAVSEPINHKIYCQTHLYFKWIQFTPPVNWFLTATAFYSNISCRIDGIAEIIQMFGSANYCFRYRKMCKPICRLASLRAFLNPNISASANNTRNVDA